MVPSSSPWNQKSAGVGEQGGKLSTEGAKTREENKNKKYGDCRDRDF